MTEMWLSETEVLALLDEEGEESMLPAPGVHVQATPRTLPYMNASGPRVVRSACQQACGEEQVSCSTLERPSKRGRVEVERDPDSHGEPTRHTLQDAAGALAMTATSIFAMPYDAEYTCLHTLHGGQPATPALQALLINHPHVYHDMIEFAHALWLHSCTHAHVGNEARHALQQTCVHMLNRMEGLWDKHHEEMGQASQVFLGMPRRSA